MSANFRILGLVFLIDLCTDLSVLKGFFKNFSFEDFQNFQEITAYGGLDSSTMTVINFGTL